MPKDHLPGYLYPATRLEVCGRAVLNVSRSGKVASAALVGGHRKSLGAAKDPRVQAIARRVAAGEEVTELEVDAIWAQRRQAHWDLFRLLEQLERAVEKNFNDVPKVLRHVKDFRKAHRWDLKP